MRTIRIFAVVALLGASACSEHGPEGTLITPGPGIEGLPGGTEGVSASHAAPVSGGTLLVLDDGVTAVAADPDRDKVFIVDLGSQAVREVALEPLDEPGRSVEDSNRRVHVALRRGGALVSIDVASATVVQRRAVCASPRGVAYDPLLDLVHVACQTGELVTLPASGGNPTRVLDLGRDLRDVVVDGGRLLVSRFKSAELVVVDGLGQITRTLKPEDSGFEPSIAWRMLPLASGGVAMLHQRANPAQIAIGPAGYYSGAGSCSGAIVEGTVSRLDPDDDGTSYNPPPPPMAMLIGPSDLAVSRDGANLAMVSIGTAWPATRSGNPVNLPKIQIFPSDTLQPADPCGQEPTSIVVTGEPIAVAFDGMGRPIVQSREPAQIQVVNGPTISLSADSRADTGVALFHMNSGFGISCASCHPEGSEDGRTWEFAEIGPRRTQSVAGGVLATAPFHWSGDVEDFTALIHEVFESRMGGTRPNKQQIAKFSSWVDRVAPPHGRVVETTAAERGRALFDDANVGCSGCHAGSQLTNNQSYDVGTGGVFQVPSLVGVAARAPFLHSGCAPTLRDRFGSCGGGDQHGMTSTLSSTQVDDLVAYLETL
jgi:hypothetical protein